MTTLVSLYLAVLIAGVGAITGMVLYVVARLGAAGRWGSDERLGDVGAGGAYRASRSVDVVHRNPPVGVRLLAALALVVGAVATPLALTLEVLVLYHRTVAVEPSSIRPWERPSSFDVVIAGLVPCGIVIDAMIAASGWSVVRRSLLRRRGGGVFLGAVFAHILIAWAIGARPAPYTPFAILYELVGMACVIVGWMLAVSKPS